MTKKIATQDCTLEHVSDIVQHHLDTLWTRPDLARRIPPIMLWGPPGVGKSDIVRGICEARGIRFLDVRLAQREPIDIRGLPVPRDDAVHWLLPAEWPRDEGSQGIILFDELTAADRTLQVAAYEFILDRRLGDLYTVPPGWYVMAAGNRTSDRAVATTMSSALANRFCHLDVRADLEAWVKWAVATGIHPDVIGFLRFKPGCLFDQKGNLERGWPSPRSWERVSVELDVGEQLPEALLRRLIFGLVGPGAATEFMAFRNWTARLPDVADMLQRRTRIVIPERADQRFGLCAAVVYHLWRVPDQATALDVFFDIGLKLPSDFASMLMADAVVEHATEQQSLTVLQHRRFDDWSRKHGTAFASRAGTFFATLTGSH